MTKNIKELKVSSKTNPKELAGSIAIEVQRTGKVLLSYIGAGAGNNAQKGIAIARGMTASQGMDLWSYPVFTKVHVKDEDEKRTGMKVVIENKGI